VSATVDDPRNELRAAIAELAGVPAPSGDRRLRLLTEAFRAYESARKAGDLARLDLRDDLPARPDLLSVALGFAAGTLSRELAHEWHPATFHNAGVWRSGLQVMLDSTGVDADVEDADETLRASGHEGHLSPAEIPDVPPSHWWWWLPDEPPTSS
jgi:hypothetical protein